jgi:hypothetical protein
MPSSLDHYREAEKILDAAETLAKAAGESLRPIDLSDLLRAAQIHATLATCQVTERSLP